MKYGYQMEKFAAARSALMLPHHQPEGECIAAAFHACSLGMKDLDVMGLDDEGKRKIRILETLMDTTGIQDPSGRGTWAIKAEQLTSDQKEELSHVIDDLAAHFSMEFWSGSKS